MNKKAKKILISSLAILMMMSNVGTVLTYGNEVTDTVKNDDEERFYFKDEVLENKVIHYVKDFYIRKKHLKEVKILGFIYDKLKHYDELLLFPNLENLTIMDLEEDREDILAKITSLKELSVHSREGSFDVSKITGLKNLEYLYIDGFDIKNIEDIAKFPKLKRLTLWGTNFDDISKIKNLRNLTSFSLFKNRNKVSEIKNLHLVNEQGINLKKLTLRTLGIRDNKAFKDLVNLEYLDLGGNNFDNLDFIKSYPNLESLNVSNNQLMDVSIFNNTKLKNDGVTFQQVHMKLDKREFELPPIIDAKGEEVPVRIDEEHIEHLGGRKYRIKYNVDQANDYCYIQWGENKNSIEDFHGSIYFTFKAKNTTKKTPKKDDVIPTKKKEETSGEARKKVMTSISTQTDVKNRKEDSSQTEVKNIKSSEAQTDVKETQNGETQTNIKTTEDRKTQTEPNVCMANERLDNILKENKANLDIIRSKDSELIKLREDLNAKLRELEVKKGEIEGLKNKEGQSNDKISKLENRIKTLEEEKNLLSEKLDRLNSGMPRDVSLGQWYPEKIVKLPSKLSYRDNEDINLYGLSILFSKYVKENGKYKKESSEVRYEDFRNGFYGWNFNLKTKKALLSETINGRMKIRFSFIYSE